MRSTIPKNETQKYQISNDLELLIIDSEDEKFKMITVYLVGDLTDWLQENLLILYAKFSHGEFTKELDNEIKKQIETYRSDKELCEQIWQTCREPKE